MTAPRQLPREIGAFIRDLRRNAHISLRQLAEQAGVSNPYLSQIERGLRKPSAEVLAQLAGALRVSTPLMYLRAGLLDGRDGQGVLAAIAADTDLTVAQRQSLTQIYETFRRENARNAADEAVGSAGTEEVNTEVSTSKVKTDTDTDTAGSVTVAEPTRRRAPSVGDKSAPQRKSTPGKSTEKPSVSATDTETATATATKTRSAAPRRAASKASKATKPRRTRATTTTTEEK